jgi:DNA primase
MVNFIDVDIRLAVGRPVGEMPIMIKCPFHQDSTASLAVYRSNIHCFGCEYHLYRRYSSLAFLVGLWDGVGDENSEVVGRMVGLVKDRLGEFIGDGSPIRSSVPPINPYLADSFHQYMLKYAEGSMVDELMFKRGLTYETIKEAKLGYDGSRFTIPVYDLDGSLYTIRYRADDEAGRVDGQAHKKYAGTRGRNTSRLYSLPNLRGLHEVEEVWVTEGEFDSLATRQEGKVAVTVTNGATSCWQAPEMACAIGLVPRRWVVALDQDAAGEAASEKLMTDLITRGQSAVRARWDKYKDIGELLAAGESIREVRYEAA